MNMIEQQIIKQTAGNLYWKDLEGRYLGCNVNFARILGYASPDAIIGKTEFDFLELDLATLIVQADKKVVETGKSITLEEKGLDEKGNIAFYLSTKTPLFDEHGVIIGLIGTSIDITRQKQAEEREKLAVAQAAKEKIEAERELRQAVAILAGSIAHDLRTPIAVIDMDSNALKKSLPILLDVYHKAKKKNITHKEQDISERQLQRLKTVCQTIQETLQQMYAFIDVTLKTLSKVLKRELTQQDLSPCSIWHCIHNTLLRYPFSKEQRELIKWDQQDFSFMGNEILMIRILFNLINNSLQQIEKNQRGEIIVSTEKADSAVNIVRFKDTAGGGSSKTISHLFDGYYTTKEKGTGVGLAFCKLAMQGFGGDMSCHSIESDYIEFVLIFPKIPNIA